MNNQNSAQITSRKSIWKELRNVMRGTEEDYTRIGLRRAIFLLAIPMILELVMESTFALVDGVRVCIQRIRGYYHHLKN